MAVLNPRLMRPQQKETTGKSAGGPLDNFVKKTPDQENSFCIESLNAIIYIGTSKDFNICTGHSVHPTTKQHIPCYRFVNTSVDKICEIHKQEITNRQLALIGNRVGVRAENVDVNAIRHRAQQAINDSVGAFGRGFKRDNRPKPILSIE